MNQNKRNKSRQKIFSQFGFIGMRLLLEILVGGIILALAVMLVRSNDAKMRDAKRLSDMSRSQIAFQMLFLETNSYKEAAVNGCSAAGSVISQCNLKKYFPAISRLRDPGKYQYLVSKVPDDRGYAITFILEKDHRDFKKGRHTLSEKGIR